MYRIFGSSGSPYSCKVRSYFRYKQLPHVWLVRNTPELMQEHAQHSKLPLVPTVVFPGGTQSMQDSTPIMEKFEELYPEPSIYPDDPALKFLSELLEEFSDEWGNKWMFHYRWKRDVDAKNYSRRIAIELNSATEAAPGDPDLAEQLDAMAQTFYDRMTKRLFTIGSNEVTTGIIESSFKDAIVLLDRHLKAGGRPGEESERPGGRPYLFGERPTIGDFGLAGQLGNALSNDPTAGNLMRLHAPHVVLWCERMLNPRAEGAGGLESFAALAPTLAPLFSRQVRKFLVWSDANAAAVAAKAKELTVDLGGGERWTQSVAGPQRYHAKSLREIRRKYAAVAAATAGGGGNKATTKDLDQFLKQVGCLELLAAADGPSRAKL